MAQWNKILNYSKGEIRAITPETGTTVNAYTEILDVDCRWLSETNFIISNTGLTNAVTYKVVAANDYGTGIGHEIIENTVAVGDSDSVILRRHARVIISVKSTATGAHTTFQIDCIAGR